MFRIGGGTTSQAGAATFPLIIPARTAAGLSARVCSSMQISPCDKMLTSDSWCVRMPFVIPRSLDRATVVCQGGYPFISR